jgi:excisionase family DNA binding protein
MNLKDYITVTEYAAKRGVSVQYVRKLLAAGKLDAIKVHDRLWLIRIISCHRTNAKITITNHHKR